MNAIKAWSFSAWDLYTSCPLKYKFEKLDKLDKGPDPEAFARGRKVHGEIAKYLTRAADFIPDNMVKSKWANLVYAEFRTMDDIIVEKQWAFNRQWKQTGWFGGAAGEAWLRTIVDAAVLYEDMEAEILDHKTGKPRKTYDDELELFALASFYHLPVIKAVRTRLVFTDYDSQPEGYFKATERDKLTAKWEAKVAPMFQDEAFNPRPGEACTFCHFARSKSGKCRFG